MDKDNLKIKVCGMKDRQNIVDLISLLPDYVGFIFFPGSKRYAGNLDPADLPQFPSGIKKTGVFVNSSFQDIRERLERFQLDAVQLHGSETADFCEQLKSLNIEIIKAFGIDVDFDFDSLKTYASVVDHFLFDTKTQLHGGSGKSFDWDLLKRYNLPVSYFLSGGLSYENIDLALKIHDSRFYGLDLNSQFETSPGVKDIQKLIPAITKIRSHTFSSKIEL